MTETREARKRRSETWPARQRAMIRTRQEANRESWREAGRRTRQEYFDTHGHWPEERAQLPRYWKLAALLTSDEKRAMTDAARAADQPPAEWLADAVRAALNRNGGA